MKFKFLAPMTLIALLAISTSSFAQTKWNHRHPRRTEVNHRLANQNKRIDTKEANGKISKAEGNKIKHQDRQVKREEKIMASQDHGHITKQEQKTLNQQENKTSQEIKNH